MDQINEEHYDNYKSVTVALKLTVNGLQDFVHGHFQRLHQNIYRKCSVGQCKVNCSRRYGNEFSRWCSTCQTWKMELKQFNRNKKHWNNIKWNTLDTIDFPISYEEVAKVFVQDFSHVRQGVLKDISAVMSLCRNLRIFNCIISDNLIANIQRSRNNCFAHNYNLELHDVEKSQCFNYFIALLKIPDIACTQSSKAALHLLEEMKTSQKIPEKILRKPSVQYTIAIIQNAERGETFDTAMAKQSSYEYLDNEQLDIRNLLAKFLRILLLLTTIALWTCIIMYGLLSENTIPVKGCLSVRFGEYWKSDLDFDLYVQEKSKESIIERSWIRQEIQTHNDPERRGILMSADMGFGKSTIVSNIVCAESKSIWYSLRQHTLVYHMCRYDLILSSKPEVFVRNLAGAIVRAIPEIGNAILSDDMALDFLYGKCAIDPVACLEFSILNKLNQLCDNRKYLIIIDAIDECETSGGIDLVGLLYKKISFFPRNFQFIITSRNIERLIYKFKELTHIDLQEYEQNNLQDIRLYLENVNHLTNEDVVKLTEISGRNFLQVKLYLHYCKNLSIDVCDSIPDSLEKIYMLNFERVFGEKGDLFEEFISVFEVLCSLQSQIDESKLFDVAGLSKEIKRKASRILGNELRHFIKISNGYISFQHKSIIDFLTDKSRKHLNFYVDSQNGHKLFAKYLLNGLNVSKMDNLIETVYHAAKAREPHYENILLEFVRELNSEKIVSNFTYLNLAAKDVNCYKTLKLFIKLVIPNKLQTPDQRFTANHSWIKNVLSEAAFIAAQYGNEKSLFALLDHGSDIMFTLHSSVPFYIMGERERAMCQYELFCGYNMLHIAAQRGYIKIVKELLRRNLTLLYQHNTMKLCAFQLAAENGHVHVLQIFLNINSSLADSHSLYLASKNGHTKAVALLLNYVEEKCLPCTVNITGRPSILTDKEQEDGQLLVHFVFNMSEIPVLKSVYDFRLLTCDTPLNIAVRNGHIKIVKILAKKSPETVNCSVYDGSTPLFTAVKYNQNEIFKYLYDTSDLSHKCRGISVDQTKLGVFEKNIFNSKKCPYNAGMEHLLAIYDNLQLIEYVFQKHYRNWETFDKEGCTPLHYAFCHGSYKFINFFVFEKMLPLDLLSRSVNGSTPFHLAAHCQSFVLHQYLQKMNETYLPIIPDVVDNQGHSIVQYGLNKSLSTDDLVKIDRLGRDDFTFSLFVVVIKFHHNLLHTDKSKNNFLHYASKAGNYWAFSLIRDSKIFKEKMHLLLMQRNQQNRTPLEVAFDTLPRRKSFEAIRIPDNCSLTDVFFVSCKANFSVLLSPHEYFILTLFQYFYKMENFSGVNISELLEISINKSRIYPILIMNVYAERQVMHIMERSTEIPFLLSMSNSLYITELLLNTDNALRCDGKKSALHEIVQNDRNIQWTFCSHILNPLFKKYSAKYLDECFDDQGYNLLHRSIMGAHLMTIQFFVERGMNLWQVSKDNKTALEIYIYNSPYTDNGITPSYYTRGSRLHTIRYVSSIRNQDVSFDYSHLISFDGITKFLLYTDENKKQLVISLLCDSKSQEFGLVHIAAAKGLFTFLKTVEETYGLDYLRCEDKFGITPMYIANIYNQKRIVHWLRKLKFKLKRPKTSSENVLLFHMIDNYKPLKEHDWTCLLRYRYIYTRIIQNQIIKCILKNRHLPIHHSWKFKKATYFALRKLIYLMNHATVFSTMGTEVDNLHFKLKSEMGYLTSKVQTTMHNLRLSVNKKHICFKTVQNKAYYLMRKLMLFGADDEDFYYVKLLTSVKKKMNSHIKNTPVMISDLFYDVYGTRYRHFSKLKMRSSLHHLWLKESQIRFTDDFQIFLKFKNVNNRKLYKFLEFSTICI
ncbi:uncharacterized protein [Mytilus edulis]|uniref:uncharacterized protein n=1 Tax=Mytilus edulis TaxID=6550 RepID=UPI0039F017E8